MAVETESSLALRILQLLLRSEVELTVSEDLAMEAPETTRPAGPVDWAALGRPDPEGVH